MTRSWRSYVGGLAAALCVLVAVASPARADDRRTDKDRLVVMTFNTEFLWDGLPPEEGSANFDWKNSPDEAREHMAKVAAVIAGCNADIVNLVEVENLDALNMLNNDFLQGRGYKAYLVQGRDTTTGQDVALLTRVDPEGNTTTYDDRKGRSGNTQKAVSKNYTAKFDVDGRKIALIGLHFLAFPNDERRAPEREAQADAIRMMALDRVRDGYEVVVLGDFNDYDGAADSKDHIDHMPSTNVLSLLRGMDPASTNDDLVNAAKWVPKAQRYTSFWDQDGDFNLDMPQEVSSIDHVLLSKALADLVDTVRIPRLHTPPDTSDHYPVVVTLRMRGTSPSPSPTPTPTPTPSNGPALRIAQLVPNPAGDENQNESVTIENTSGASVSLTGWKLRDKANTVWALDRENSIAAHQKLEVKRLGRAMGLNNTGDTVELVDPSGAVVDTVTFGRCDEDEVVTH